MEKYFVMLDKIVIGIIYDNITHKISIGGNCKFIGVIENLIYNYFDLKKAGDQIRFKYTQKNKIRFNSKMNREKFLKAVQYIKEQDGINIIQTKKLGRVMI